MVDKTLLKAEVRRHKGMLFCIFILIFLVSLALGTVITVWTNSAKYLKDELERVGFGEMTAWVSGVPSSVELATELSMLDSIESVKSQALIFSSYSANEQKSDSEGQLIAYDTHENRYRFFTENLSGYSEAPTEILQGEVYVSPSLISTFGIGIGDTVVFAIARNGGNVALTVKGFYEDPIMGSSMIGMKGFLISAQSMCEITSMVQSTGINALAREGARLHIFSAKTDVTMAELNRIINENTSLPSYTEFVHSADAILGFMLILQNIFSGLLTAFVLVLLLVVLIALGHGITSNIAAESKDIGILMAIGLTGKALCKTQLFLYAIALFPAMLLGVLFIQPFSAIVSDMMLRTTGMMFPTHPPWRLCISTFAAVLALLSAFIVWKTARIHRIKPIQAIRGIEVQEKTHTLGTATKISGRHLNISLAIRQLLTGRNQYVSAVTVAIALVFFASMVGRIDSWLGTDGKGMMEAFNPADHDIGVQMFGQHTLADAQTLASGYTDITDSYQLAMVSTSVNGIDYSTNVISKPARFHILQGRTSTADNEIVVTEFVAADLDVWVGDTLTVTGELGSSEYIISGIYTCANNMGSNIGMSREGYLKIGSDIPQIWCDHYFLADTSQKPAIIKALTAEFGGDVHVHENTWPGLIGILSAMRILIVFLYIMVALLIFIITTMTASKLLASQKREFGIYKAIGFADDKLRISFALRFALAAAIGAILGVCLSTVLTDLLISSVMKLAGISNFASNPSVLAVAFPAIIVVLLFFAFAYIAAAKIKKTDLTALVTE